LEGAVKTEIIAGGDSICLKELRRRRGGKKVRTERAIKKRMGKFWKRSVKKSLKTNLGRI